MTPLLEYLTDGTLSAETNKARSIKIKSRQYAVIDGVLYRKSFLKQWLRCVGPLQAEYVRIEIHEGSCSMHSGPRSIVAKAIRSDNYWPTMHKDGIDISGPFLEAQGNVKFLIVAIDYYTKWIEAKPVTTITGNQVKKFVWDNIVCRFGLPEEILSDNGNLRERIKARLGEDNRNWVEEVPHVLWAHHTMIKTRNENTPFSLTYGTEAVIPVEIWIPSLSNEANHAKESGKLGSKWEGPYEVVEALEKGANKLINGCGDILPQTLNVKGLKKCYL
nr:hypothetical protein [Tanacetum cinerariifolium]